MFQILPTSLIKPTNDGPCSLEVFWKFKTVIGYSDDMENLSISRLGLILS